MKAQNTSSHLSRSQRRSTSRRKPSFVDRYRGAIFALAGAIFVGGLLLIAVLEATGSSESPSASPSQPLDAATLQSLTSIPDNIFAEVGSGTAANAPEAISGTSLTEDGKPEVLYVGAEFCPFCAAERWPLLLALSRFGSFSGISESHSAAEDVFPNTPTVSFYGSTYESDYLAFTAVETATNQRVGNSYEPLQSLTSEQQEILNRYNAGGGIPFLYLAGEYSLSGASFSPSLLAGMDIAEVTAALADADSAPAQAIVGSANVLTAALCELTGGEPGEVCQSSAVVEAAAELN